MDPEWSFDNWYDVEREWYPGEYSTYNTSITIENQSLINYNESVVGKAIFEILKDSDISDFGIVLSYPYSIIDGYTDINSESISNSDGDCYIDFSELLNTESNSELVSFVSFESVNNIGSQTKAIAIPSSALLGVGGLSLLANVSSETNYNLKNILNIISKANITIEGQVFFGFSSNFIDTATSITESALYIDNLTTVGLNAKANSGSDIALSVSKTFNISNTADIDVGIDFTLDFIDSLSSIGSVDLFPYTTINTINDIANLSNVESDSTSEINSQQNTNYDGLVEADSNLVKSFVNEIQTVGNISVDKDLVISNTSDINAEKQIDVDVGFDIRSQKAVESIALIASEAGVDIVGNIVVSIGSAEAKIEVTPDRLVTLHIDHRNINPYSEARVMEVGHGFRSTTPDKDDRKLMVNISSRDFIIDDDKRRFVVLDSCREIDVDDQEKYIVSIDGRDTSVQDDDIYIINKDDRLFEEE